VDARPGCYQFAPAGLFGILSEILSSGHLSLVGHENTLGSAGAQPGVAHGGRLARPDRNQPRRLRRFLTGREIDEENDARTRPDVREIFALHTN
jgi:hypothetical protein